MILSNMGRTLAGLFLTGALGLVGCKGTVVTGGGGDDGPPGGPAAVCGAELHLIGVYETHSNHGSGIHPAGAATVHVERKASSILVLSSYEPVHWTVTAAEGVTLEKVILNGYHDQTADVPAGVQVEVYDGPDGSLGAYAYAWPSSEGGSDTQGLVAAVENLTGRPLTSFHGCYQATGFVLRDDLGTDAACTEGQGTLTSHVDEGAIDCESTPPGSNECAGKDGPGVYEFAFCQEEGGWGYTPDISCQEALDNCLLNSSLNPTISMICRWNNEILHLAEKAPAACDGY